MRFNVDYTSSLNHSHTQTKHYSKAKVVRDSPVPLRTFPSALRQDKSGMGTPMVPQRNITLFPTALRTRATAVCMRGIWQRRNSASLKSTPERLSGAEQRSRVSINATESVGDF